MIDEACELRNNQHFKCKGEKKQAGIPQCHDEQLKCSGRVHFDGGHDGSDEL